MAEHNGIRNGVIALAVVAAAAIGGFVYYTSSRPAALPPPPPAPAPKPAPTPAGPQFDILRVDSSGNAVIAGRADPGATVTIKDGNTVLGTVIADTSGAFAFVPANPLPPGPHQLTLSETLFDGTVVAGQTSASVDVAANPSGQSLTVITGPNGSKVLSGQGPVAGTLGIGTVDYDANGHAIFSGTAHAGDHIALSLNGAKIGTAIAGPDGRWRLTATTPDADGTLSVADTDKPGIKPLTAPFALETLQNAVAQGHIVIVPGQNLWLIARHVYGRGTLYTLIYKANSTLIRDPNLIFPGQAFSIPKAQD
jgi:nucleoid-associated protein YgaU